MNAQVRRVFVVVLVLFLTLGAAITLIQFFQAPGLYADPRNSRQILQAMEKDRGPIIVDDSAIVFSERAGGHQYRRDYAEGPLYSAVTGYFSSVNMSATGMEAAADTILQGDTSELFLQRMRNLIAGRPRQGGGIKLTLKSAMQQVAAENLDGRSGAVVALDVKTGAVLSLYSAPSFDPNLLATLDSQDAQSAYEQLVDDPARPLNNRAIASDRYAPGSVFKILTAVTMLENGVTPQTKLPSPVSITLPGTDTQLSNIEQSECGDGNVTLEEAFARSCNTTFALASEHFTDKQLRDVTARFGFGAPLAIPLTVTPSYFPSDLTAAQLATSAIGQFDVAVTPMEMALITASIANGGVAMQPYLVSDILDADNEVVSTTKPGQLATPVSPEVADQVRQMMVGVVQQPYGTGGTMAIPGTTVGGKTGTAEVGAGDRTNAWAVAFAPAEDPQIAVAVLVEGDDNDPLPHGGPVAGPIARQLLEVGLNG